MLSLDRRGNSANLRQKTPKHRPLDTILQILPCTISYRYDNFLGSIFDALCPKLNNAKIGFLAFLRFLFSLAHLVPYRGNIPWNGRGAQTTGVPHSLADQLKSSLESFLLHYQHIYYEKVRLGFGFLEELWSFAQGSPVAARRYVTCCSVIIHCSIITSSELMLSVDSPKLIGVKCTRCLPIPSVHVWPKCWRRGHYGQSQVKAQPYHSATP